MSDRTPPRRPEKTPWRDSNASDLVFHYDRSEREAMRTRVWTPPSGGFLRRNRSLAILLIDAVIVVGLFLLFLFVILPMQRRVTLAGYQVTVDAIAFAEEIVVRARVVPVDSADRTDQPIITVSAAGLETADLAPRGDTTRTVRLNVPRTANEVSDALDVAVAIDGDTHTFSVDLSD